MKKAIKKYALGVLDDWKVIGQILLWGIQGLIRLIILFLPVILLAVLAHWVLG